MSSSYRYCRLCSKFSVNPRYLSTCKHSFCLDCIVSYYDQRQSGSVMRIAAFPCPEPSCRMLSEVPPGGVRYFPTSTTEVKRTDPETPESERGAPEIPETIRGSPRTPERKLKKRVTFSDPETPKKDDSVDRGTPRFRSTVSFTIGRIQPQQGVDIPDSALDLATPRILTGSDVIDRRKNRFFPSDTSVSSEPEMNGVKDTLSDSSAIVMYEIKPDVRSQETTNNRFPVENNHTTIGQPNHQNPDSPMRRPEEESHVLGVSLSWRQTKNAHHKPTSMVITPQGLSIVADYGKGTLDYLDETGQTTLSVNTLKPFAVLLTPSGSVVVGDRRTKTLVFLEATTAEVVSSWETGCFEWVSGLGSLRNGNLVVADRANCRIGIYTPEGRMVLEFGSYGSGGDNFCMADFLTVDSRDRIIVSDSANHCLKVFDATGFSLVSFSGRGSSDGLLSWPKGVCVDRLDNIIVADSKNGRLSMFSTSGGFIEHLVSGARSPFGVCYQMESDRLGVTHHSISGYSQCDVYQLNQNI